MVLASALALDCSAQLWQGDLLALFFCSLSQLNDLLETPMLQSIVLLFAVKVSAFAVFYTLGNLAGIGRQAPHFILGQLTFN